MADRVAVMRDSRIEQVDRQQAIYERPANVFVAGFIGSPAMNLVHSRIEADNGFLCATLGEHRSGFRTARCAGPARPLRRARPRARASSRGPCRRPPGPGRRSGDDDRGRRRPGRAARGGDDLHFDAKAETARAEAALETDDDDQAHLTAPLDGQSAIEAGDRVPLAVDVERLYFFDRETGAAIA